MRKSQRHLRSIISNTSESKGFSKVSKNKQLLIAIVVQRFYSIGMQKSTIAILSGCSLKLL